MIGKSCFSSEFLGDCLIFDFHHHAHSKHFNNSLWTPEWKSFFFFQLLLKMLNATVAPQFESYCPSFFLDWVNKLCRSSVETHGVTRGFTFYWFTNLFGWKDNKTEYVKLDWPHMSGVQTTLFTLSRTFLTLKLHTHHCFLRRLPLTEDVGIIPIIQSPAPFSAHVGFLQIFQAKVNPSSSHTHLGLVALAQSFLSIKIISKYCISDSGW